MAKSPKNEIDEELVKNLTRLLEENNLTEIEYGRDGWHIRVGRGGGVTVSESRRGNLEPDAAPGPEASSAAGSPNAVTSPMVGVVFFGPDPDSPPFVKPGDEVAEGQTLLLIEAMKVFNPITAPKSGRVTEILVANGAPVEFGELLLILE
ncbi:MAG: acetyl-CoA carboxylase biotin carboxyl carrier protein subunit [Rhodospirillaceae bacterium]|jgi:acetyl-CoA carboxylase biotin carboxyl carrier protein|nr:acetyl-CoA carboxylase biotin carboxyl carrier protein subunit [Rhodospirillaceae bacterium]